MRLEPVELSLAHFSLSQLVGLRATTKQAILSETHLTYWNKPSTRANLTFQALEPHAATTFLADSPSSSLVLNWELKAANSLRDKVPCPS